MNPKNIATLVTTLTTILAFAGCATLPRVDHQPVPTNGEKGVAFYLPKTLLAVKLNLVLTTTKASPFLYPKPTNGAKDKMKALGIEPFEKNSTELEIKISPDGIGSIQVPDYEERLLVKWDTGPMEDSNLTISLSEDGIIQDASADNTNKTIDYAIKALETAANLANIAVMGARGPQPENSATEKQLDDLLAGIVDLRNARREIITGKANVITGLTADAIKLLLDQSVEAEKQIIKAIAGSKATAQSEVLLEIDPADFDSKTGEFLIAKAVPDGKECRIQFEIPAKEKSRVSVADIIVTETPKWEALKVRLVKDPTWKTAGNSSVEAASRSGSGSFVYRIPRPYEVSLITTTAGATDGLILRKKVLIAQHGYVAQLPRSFGSSNVNAAIFFHNTTGALRKLELKTKGYDSTAVSNRVAGVVESVVSPKTRDELYLASLEREKKIRALEKELGISDR